jgi:hypothetical protein
MLPRCLETKINLSTTSERLSPSARGMIENHTTGIRIKTDEYHSVVQASTEVVYIHPDS